MVATVARQASDNLRGNRLPLASCLGHGTGAREVTFTIAGQRTR